MKHFLLCLLLVSFFLFPSFVRAQFAENIQTIGGSYGDYVVKIIHDKNDNRYILGVIGQPGSVNIPGYQPEQIDFGSFRKEVTRSFIAKYNQDNQCVWVRPGPLAIDNSFHDLAVDDAGFVYFTRSSNIFDFVLEKLDKNGNSVWEKRFRPETVFSENYFRSFKGDNIAVDKQGNIYVSGYFDGSDFGQFSFDFTSTREKPDTEFLAKFNPEGEVVWVKTSLESGLRYTHLLIDSQGNVVTAGSLSKRVNISGYILENKNPPNSYGHTDSRFFVVRDPDGNVIWAKNYPVRATGFGPKVVLDADDNIYFMTSFFDGDTQPVSIDGILIDKSQPGSLIKLNSIGAAQWAINLSGSNTTSPLIYADQNLYLAGSFSFEYKFQGEALKPNKDWINDIFLIKLNLDGKKEWIKRFGGPSYEETPQLTFLPKRKELVLAATFGNQLTNNTRTFTSKGWGDIFIGQIPDTVAEGAALNARISGKLYNDDNANCSMDTTEIGLAHKLLKIEPGDLYAMTDEKGNYSVRVPYGTLTVTPLISPAAKSQIIVKCRERASVTTDSSHQKESDVNFGYKITDCSHLTIDIAADRRRRCFRSKTTVTYANDGTADARNVKIKVLYPRYVVPIKSSLAWAARQDSALIFDIGTLKAGERRRFTITDSTICDNENIRGLSQCVKAIITPKNTCISPGQDWDQSSVAVEAQLTDDDQTASFTIANEGEGDMADSSAYRVYANEALVEQGSVKLAKGEKTTLQVPMPAATLRLEANQSPNHPGKSRPTASIQPPLVLPSRAAPTPIDAAYQDDADAEVSISCLNIIDSFDPNDKQVTPQGITRRHYIKAEDELEYQIRFQNTGTDTAYTVVVQDTLSAFVDVASLRIGAASHPFTYTVSGKGQPVLTFTFKNINLPDHKTNEPASHGYIRFRIGQTPGNSKGTVIKNLAYNYFDYNSPIATNEVFNIIGDTIITPVVPVVVYDCSKAWPTTARAGADVRLCEASETVLQANAPVQGLGRWRILSGQATLSDATNPQATLSNIGYGEVVLAWTITLCERVSSSQVTVYRYAIPAAPAVTAPPLQCEGSQLLPLTASGSHITWYADAQKQRKLHEGASYTPQVSVTTTFYATQTVNGCESPATAATVRIYPAQVDFDVTGDTLVAPAADSYRWYFNGQELEGATGQKYFVKNTGSYFLKTITNGCVSMSSPVDHTIQVAQASLRLHPNPASNQLHLELAAQETGEVSLLIWDQLGRRVGAFSSQKAWTVLEHSLDLDLLKPGLYLLEARIGKEILTRKFVKQ